MTGLCPFCRREVELLPPRPVSSMRRLELPWRRRQHAVVGDLSAQGARRCRWPLTLNPDEIPTGEPTCTP